MEGSGRKVEGTRSTEVSEAGKDNPGDGDGNADPK
jgi:hypothetical protein